MKIRDIAIVATCAVIIFVAGAVVGHMMPRCHGYKGFHHMPKHMMCDKGECKGDPEKCTCGEDCPCKRKMMQHDGEFKEGMPPMMKEGCGCQKDKKGPKPVPAAK